MRAAGSSGPADRGRRRGEPGTAKAEPGATATSRGAPAPRVTTAHATAARNPIRRHMCGRIRQPSTHRWAAALMTGSPRVRYDIVLVWGAREGEGQGTEASGRQARPRMRGSRGQRLRDAREQHPRAVLWAQQRKTAGLQAFGEPVRNCRGASAPVHDAPLAPPGSPPPAGLTVGLRAAGLLRQHGAAEARGSEGVPPRELAQFPAHEWAGG